MDIFKLCDLVLEKIVDKEKVLELEKDEYRSHYPYTIVLNKQGLVGTVTFWYVYSIPNREGAKRLCSFKMTLKKWTKITCTQNGLIILE